MKSTIKILSLFIGLAALVFSCTKDEIDVAALTDFPPGIVSITPANNAKVVVGNFDIKVEFADGQSSPLSTATVTLSDDFGNQLASETKSLSGTRDSLVVLGSSFNAELLGPGVYNMSISVTDSKGQETTRDTKFEISLLPFAANNNEMYLAGPFNGWGADELTLVADYTWEIVVDLQGDEFKLKNTPDWTDQDWGDSNCDGVLENTTGGGPNTPAGCVPSGEVRFRFNDQTLAYTVSPLVEFDTDLSGLYLLGSFNNFEGSEYKFNLVDDNTWELAEVELQPGDKFKFAEGPNFMGRNWGDNEGDGIAEEFGSNIMFMEQGAFFSITFNEKSLEYTLNFLRFPSIGLIGDATPNGWDGPDHDMTDNGDGTFSLVIDLVDGFAKFRANDDWPINWGSDEWPFGVAVQDGPNIPVVAARYEVTFNPESGEYSFVEDAGFESVAIIGDATPNGWDGPDHDMNDNGDGTYSLLIGLKDGVVKFRANDDWPINWGADAFPTGTGTQDGPDIPVTAGLYWVSFNSATGEYSFEEATVGLIGDATPNGWEGPDHDLAQTAENPSVLSLTIDLVDGSAKFRMNDDWPVNWGAADFPSGIGVQNGPDIPVTAGTYDVSFNVLTGEYSFE